MNNLPWFVFPVSLEIYLNARHTYKQLLTLYNPYDFAVNFKVLCTSPHKFSVVDPEGVIAPQSCIDIVVRYSQSNVSQTDSSDKFRINMFHRKTQQPLGKRDIPIKYLEGEPSNISSESIEDNSFQPITSKGTKSTAQNESRQINQGIQRTVGYREQQPNFVAILVSICCIAALLMPTHDETFPESQMPKWMHVSVNLKLVFSYVLGLVSMLVLRP